MSNGKEPRTFRPQVWAGALPSLLLSTPPPEKTKPKAGIHGQYEKGLRHGRRCGQGETPALCSGFLLPHFLG